MEYGPGGLRFSTKSRYAIIILADLAANDKKRPRSVQEIANSTGVSSKYISRLVIPLRKAGLIGSVIGSNGGYILEAEPSLVKILDIIDLMDGPFHLCKCLGDTTACPRFATCKPYPVWKRIDDRLRSALDGFTLQEMVDTLIADFHADS